MTLSYPEKPTEEAKKRMANLIKGFSIVYACRTCREDFQKEIEKRGSASSDDDEPAKGGAKVKARPVR